MLHDPKRRYSRFILDRLGIGSRRSVGGFASAGGGTTTPPVEVDLRVLLVDEQANTLERIAYNQRVIGRYLNPLILAGTLRLRDTYGSELVLGSGHVTDALGHVPADAATSFVGGPGINISGTLGAPGAISVDDSVVRFVNIGNGVHVVFVQNAGTAPNVGASGGLLLYVDPATGNLNAIGESGTVTTVAVK